MKGFEVDEAMMTDFLALAEKEKVEFDEALYQRSADFIRMQIKALIARNIWDMEAYYQVVSEQDETILQALEILEKNDMFSEVIHPEEK